MVDSLLDHRTKFRDGIHRIRRMVVVLISLCVVYVPSPAVQVRGAAQADNETRTIENLIGSLASANAAPRLDRSLRTTVAVYPKDYSQQAQQRVVAAWERLLAKGESAFPQLIAHLQDTRYSYTETFNDSDANVCVGAVCYDIVAAQIELFRPYVRLVSEPPALERLQWIPSFAAGQDAMEAWWKKNQGQSLRDLQLQSVEWALRGRE